MNRFRSIFRLLFVLSFILISVAIFTGPAAAETDVYLGIPFHPFTLDGSNDTCIDFGDEDIGPTRNCDPINLIFPDRTWMEVRDLLLADGWSTCCAGGRQGLHFSTPEINLEDEQLVKPNSYFSPRYHIRLWQAPGDTTVTFAAVHHEYYENFAHIIDMDWEQAEADVANALCGQDCGEPWPLPRQSEIQDDDGTWRPEGIDNLINDASASVIPGPAMPNSPPDAPTQLLASAFSQTQIDLTWTDNSSNEDGYRLERSPDGSTGWALIATLGANITSYSDAGLSSGTTYYYRALAFNTTGNSSYSDTASATTFSAPTPTTTPVPTATPTDTQTPTNTPTSTPVPTATPTNTPLPTATPTDTPLPTITPTNTPLPTATPTDTPVPTATATDTPVPTATATDTPVPPATPTDTPTSESPSVDTISSGMTDGMSLVLTHTTSGSERLMLVGVSLNNDNFETVASITYGGSSLTLVNSETQSDDARVEIWQLVAPPVGSHDVVITFNDDLIRYAVAGAITFSGVDQTEPLRSFTGNNATSNSASVSAPSATNDLVLAIFSCETCTSVSILSPATKQWTLVAGAGNEIGAGATLAGSGSAAIISATLGSSDHWAMGAVSIKAGVMGGPTSTPTSTPTSSNTPTSTNTAESPTATATNTAAPTSTSTNTPIATNTSTPSPTPTPTAVNSDTGWLNPTANMAESTGDGDGYETDAVRAHSDDNLYAVDFDSGRHKQSSCLSAKKDGHRFLNYGVSLPPGADVTGVEVGINIFADATFGDPHVCVQLSGDGGATWTTPRTTPILSAVETEYTIGGAGDSWGQSWDEAGLANGNFRVRLVNVSSDITRDFWLDLIGVRVFYAGTGPTPTPTPTIASTPTNTPTAGPTATPSSTPATTPTNTPSPTPAGSTSVHVSDLDGNGTSQGSTWTASVHVKIVDDNGNPVADATVSGNWAGGASGSDNCITDGTGWCTVIHGSILKRNGTATFTTDNVSHSTLIYDSSANVDPDGDSNGTTIVVSK